MTTITIDLPDSLANDLNAKAAAWKMSLSEVLEEAAIQLILNEGKVQQGPLDLSSEEEAAVIAARADLDAGRVVSHESAMAHFRKVLAR